MIIDGRLFLFLPRFIVDTICTEEEKDKPELHKWWTIRMCWTKYRNGKWTPQKLPDENFKVNDPKLDTSQGTDDEKKRKKMANKFPRIETFRFGVHEREATLPKSGNGNPEHKIRIPVINVDRWIEPVDPRNAVSSSHPARWSPGNPDAADSTRPKPSPEAASSTT